MNSTDTTIYSAMSTGKLFSPKDIDEKFFVNGILFYNAEDKKEVIDAQRIKYLEFIDYKSQKRKFVNVRLIDNSFGYNQYTGYQPIYLIEEMETGKLCWYKRYKINPWNGGSTIAVLDCFSLNGKLTCFGGFKSVKKKLKNLLSDNPEVVEMIDTTRFAASIYNQLVSDIVKKYNSSYKK